MSAKQIRAVVPHIEHEEEDVLRTQNREFIRGLEAQRRENFLRIQISIDKSVAIVLGLILILAIGASLCLPQGESLFLEHKRNSKLLNLIHSQDLASNREVKKAKAEARFRQQQKRLNELTNKVSKTSHQGKSQPQEHSEKIRPDHLHLQNQQVQDRYDFDIKKYRKSGSLQKILKGTQSGLADIDSKYYHVLGQPMIRKLETKFAIDRLQLNHNVNFLGEVVVQKASNKVSQKEQTAKQLRLKKLLKEEEQLREYSFEISKYKQHPHRFCIVVPSFNNARSRIYLRNLDSIFMQAYDNYHVVYLDDASPDNTPKFVKQYMEDHPQIPAEKLTLVTNTQNVGAMANIYNGIHNHCPNGEIVMMLDGDDSLIGRQVLSTFNAIFHQKRAGFVYSNNLAILPGTISPGSSQRLPEEQILKGKFRKLEHFYTNHLRSFYADAFKMIDKSDFTYPNGTFLDYSSDVAFCTPLVEMLFPRVQFVNIPMYEYRTDAGSHARVMTRKAVSKMIYHKKPYQQLEDFSFIDDFYKGIKYTKTGKQSTKNGEQTTKKGEQKRQNEDNKNQKNNKKVEATKNS